MVPARRVAPWMAIVAAIALTIVGCARHSKSRGPDAPSWRILMPADTTRTHDVRIIERLRDDDGDGRIDALEIEAFVPVDSTGDYVIVRPELRAADERLIALGTSPRRSFADSTRGSPLRFEADSLRIGRVRIAFDGEAIRQGAVDGPWTVRFGAAATRGVVRDAPERADRTYEAHTSRHRAAAFGRSGPILDAAPSRKW